MNTPGSSSLQEASILRTWWPLAASWLLMGAELPAISGVVGRLPNAEIMLAAFGGVVFPIALLIESPIIMMLAASTAWSRDTASFRQLERFMYRAAIALTILHAAIAFTPLYQWVVVPLLDVPKPVQPPALLGLRIMVLWNLAIADRRFRQGSLIRFGHRETIARGTVVRLAATFLALWMFWRNGFSGIVTATASLSIGVLVEAFFVRWRAAVLLPRHLAAADTKSLTPPTTSLVAFYVPLAVTPMLILALQPIAAAGITRMPMPLECLAVWGPLGGLIFLLRSAGIAFNEVVIARCDEPDGRRRLRRFAWSWGAGFSGILTIMAVTPLADLWFRGVIGLEPELARLGTQALWLAAPLPLLTFLESYWQGMLVSRHRTRAVTGSVAAFLIVAVIVIAAGVLIGHWNGLLVTLAAFAAGNIAQTLWLRWKWQIEGPRRPEQPEQGIGAPEPL
ncbi:MAG: hypothetical protein GY894_08350 [Planctomycetes bacterium]|nr:hypothetical protein [Planctomycetota bacterium]MCP4839354.1 hypothetical protein [Planctomycetota bacterium]